MSASTVYYLVDSNLFFQCLPLEQLDWASWKNYDEVRLIVSNPVLREIDFRKNKGNDRVVGRARATSAMFRKMLKDAHKVIRASGGKDGYIVTIKPFATRRFDPRPATSHPERDSEFLILILLCKILEIA